MSKEQNIRLLKAHQKKLKEYEEAFWELCSEDFVSPLTEREIKQELLEYADNILNRSEKQPARLIRYATLLKDKKIRSSRADTLIRRRNRKEERRLAKTEQIARIIDDCNLDGSLFRRDFIPTDNPLSLQQAKRLEKKKDIISKAIAELEKSADKSIIPEGTELLSVSQAARFLGWGESVVRQRDKVEKLLPEPCKFGGTIQWSRRELLNWIDAGCPQRQEWELQKQRKAV